MARRIAALVAFIVALTVVGLVAQSTQTTSGAATKPQAAQTFRSSITLVPIDVKVLDKNGKPVTDLKQEDFQLLEDGKPVNIAHFEFHTLKPDVAAKAARPPARLTPFDSVPQSNRIFLIVLGRGRLNEPSKGLDSVIDFVRNKLLPQDQVAVFAYDRATDFTTDHEQVAKLVERFKAVHYDINMDVTNQTASGLAAIYGSKGIPKNLQAKIDSVFQGSGQLAFKEIGKGVTADTKRAEADSQQAAAALQRADVKNTLDTMDAQAKAAMGNDVASVGLQSWTFADEISATQFNYLGLDDFMQNTAQSLQDLGSCYAAIEYMRHVEGEKHLLFVTEAGMYMPRVDDDEALAKAANDARVAIDTFQTGGLKPQYGSALQNNWTETFAFKMLRNISEWTGGVSAITEDGPVVMNRLNEATLSDYVIGYYPSLARFDGSYRKIAVKVNRPGVSVLYRQGYYARREVGSFDRRTFITRDRLEAAAKYDRGIKDIKVKLDASMKKVEGGHQLEAKLNIDATKLALTVENGLHTGVIDIFIVFSGDKGQMIDQYYRHADLKLNEEVWQKVKSGGIPFQVTVPIDPGCRNVRAIIYDYRADLIGSADARVF